jgi:hypothetical protein
MKSMPRIAASSVKWSIIKRKPVSMFTLDRFNSEINRFSKKEGLIPPGHTKALNAKKYDELAWKQYFKFVVVRNPWDHAVSYYYWLLNFKNLTIEDVTFKEFLKRMDDWDRSDPERVRPGRKSGWEIYTIKDQIAVDYVARFEELENELRVISERIGIPVNAKIRAKGDIRDKTKSLQEHYDNESVGLVASIYRKEIDYFGYRAPF